MLVGGYTNSVCFFHTGSNHWFGGALPRVQGYNAIKIYQLCVWCTFLLFSFTNRKKQKDITLTRVGFPRLQQFSWVSIFLRLPPLQFLWRKTKKATNHRPSNLMNTSPYRIPHLPPLSIAFSVMPLNEHLSSAQSPLPLYLSLRAVSAV